MGINANFNKSVKLNEKLRDVWDIDHTKKKVRGNQRGLGGNSGTFDIIS